MAKITLKSLYQEGRLSLGDTLTHEDKGDFELINVMADGQLVVKNQAGETLVWELLLPEGCKVVQVNHASTE